MENGRLGFYIGTRNMSLSWTVRHENKNWHSPQDSIKYCSDPFVCWFKVFFRNRKVYKISILKWIRFGLMTGSDECASLGHLPNWWQRIFAFECSFSLCSYDGSPDFASILCGTTIYLLFRICLEALEYRRVVLLSSLHEPLECP